MSAALLCLMSTSDGSSASDHKAPTSKGHSDCYGWSQIRKSHLDLIRSLHLIEPIWHRILHCHYNSFESVPYSEGSSLSAVHSAHCSPVASSLLSPGHALHSLECEPNLHFASASHLVWHAWIVVDRKITITESKWINHYWQVCNSWLFQTFWACDHQVWQSLHCPSYNLSHPNWVN